MSALQFQKCIVVTRGGHVQLMSTGLYSFRLFRSCDLLKKKFLRQAVNKETVVHIGMKPVPWPSVIICVKWKYAVHNCLNT
jgi:hypothetical protein